MKNINQQIVECVFLTHELQALIERKEDAAVKKALRNGAMSDFLLSEAFTASDDEVGDEADKIVNKLNSMLDGMVQMVSTVGDSWAPVAEQIAGWKSALPDTGIWDSIFGKSDEKKAEQAAEATGKLTKVQGAMATMIKVLQDAAEAAQPNYDWLKANGEKVAELMNSGGESDVSEGEDEAGSEDEGGSDAPQMDPDPANWTFENVENIRVEASEKLEEAGIPLPEQVTPDELAQFVKSRIKDPPGWFKNAQSAAAKSTGIMGKGVAILKSFFTSEETYTPDAEAIAEAIWQTKVSNLGDLKSVLEETESEQQSASEEIADGSTDILAAGSDENVEGSGGGGDVVTPDSGSVEQGRSRLQGNDAGIQALVQALNNAGVQGGPDDWGSFIQSALSGYQDLDPSTQADADAVISQVDEEVVDEDGNVNEESLEARIAALEARFAELAGGRLEDIAQEETSDFEGAADLLKLGSEIFGDGEPSKFATDMLAHEPLTTLFAHKNHMLVHRNSLASLLSEGEDAKEAVEWEDILAALKGIGEGDPEYEKPDDSTITKFFTTAMEKELLPKSISGLDSGESEGDDDEPKFLKDAGTTKEEFLKAVADASAMKELQKLINDDPFFAEWASIAKDEGVDLTDPNNYAETFLQEVEERGPDGMGLSKDEVKSLDGIMNFIEEVLGSTISKLEAEKKELQDLEDPDEADPALPQPMDPEEDLELTDDAVPDVVNAASGEETTEDAPDSDAPANPEDMVDQEAIDTEDDRGVEQAIFDALNNWKEELSDRQKKRVDAKGRFDQLKDPRMKNATPPETDDVDGDKIGGVFDDWRNDPGNKTLQNDKNFSQNRLDALRAALTDVIPAAAEEGGGDGPGEGDLPAKTVAADISSMVDKDDMTADRLQAKLKEMEPGENIQTKGFVDGNVARFEEEGEDIKVAVVNDDGKETIADLSQQKDFSASETNESAISRWAKLAGLPVL